MQKIKLYNNICKCINRKRTLIKKYVLNLKNHTTLAQKLKTQNRTIF